MDGPDSAELARRLTALLSDAFNRTLSALENAGAFDATELRKGYSGVGSKYYDIVTEQLEVSVNAGAPWIAELFKPGTN